jgi:translation elongation factor EF-Ts
MKFVNQIRELRSIIPVGIKKAMQILEENNGDIELAVKQTKIELTNSLIEKTGTNFDTAINTLQ